MDAKRSSVSEVDYYDPKKGLSSAYKMYKRSDGIKYDDIRKSLNKEEPYQLNKQDHTVVYFPITGKGKFSYQADLMFVDDKPILCIINVNTRVAYAYLMKNKSELQTYDKFKEWIDNIKVPIRYLQTDRGSEFNNAKVKELFEKNKIEHNMVNVEDHAGQGKIERFNQTLRRLITLYETSSKKKDWKNVLDDLIYNYNHRFHRSINGNPIDADEETEWARQLAKTALAQKALDNFKVGDRVRVLITKRIFDKGRKRWSEDVYEIEAIEGNRLRVDGKLMKHYELQKIEGDVSAKKGKSIIEINNKLKEEKRVTRALNKEGIEKNEVGRTKRVIGLMVRKNFKKDGTLNGKVISYKDPYYKVKFANEKVTIDDEITLKEVEMLHERYKEWNK